MASDSIKKYKERQAKAMAKANKGKTTLGEDLSSFYNKYIAGPRGKIGKKRHDYKKNVEGGAAPVPIRGRSPGALGGVTKKATATTKKRGMSPGALGGKTPSGKSPGALGGKAPTSFSAAFKAARKRLGAGKTFSYKGKKYSTNTKADLAKKKIASKKRIDPFAIKSKASKSGIDGGSFKGVKKRKVSTASKAGLNGVTSKKKSTKKNVMSTKDIRYYKGTNITPTKLQRDRMRKRKLAST